MSGCGPGREEGFDEAREVGRVSQALSVGLDVRISAGADDAEESSTGSMSLTSTDMELVRDGSRGDQVVGLRFPNLALPRGATINDARLVFAVDETGSTATSLSIRAQAADTAPAFTTATRNLSSRTRTTAQVSWAPSAWSSLGTLQTSPNLAAVVQEVTNRSGWASGNALAFVITGTGTRTADAFEDSATTAPLLHVDYTAPAPAPVCGDASCNASESCASCAADCGVCPPACGDGTCDASETCDGCAADCGACPPPPVPCGNAVCDATETCSSCPTDCGSCPPPGASVSEVRIATSAGDAEESSAGAVSLNSTDVELVNDGSRGDQIIGLRFPGLNVPKGATVTAARVIFAVDETGSAATNLSIRAENADDSAVFTTATRNVSSRPRTSQSVSWAPSAWSSVGQLVQTPDLSALVQAVVNRTNWQGGNALSLIVTGTGKRTADAFEDSAATAPLLHVEYVPGTVTPPVCGDAVCQLTESCQGCAADCGSCAAATRIAVVGDFGMNNSSEASVAALVDGWGADAVVTVGDNNYPSGAASTIDANIGKYFSEYIGNYSGAFGTGSQENRFWPALGNHDWMAAGAAPYLAYFTLPGNERYYDVDRGVVHLYVLDSDPHEPDGVTQGSAQGAWLMGRLAASTSCWDLVFFHHAAYSSDRTHGSNTQMRWPFEQWGADAVVSGHAHTYERLQVGGIPYFVNGLGGAATYSFNSPLPQSVARYNANFGAMLITASNGSINYAFYSTDGVKRDEHSVTKNCP